MRKLTHHLVEGAGSDVDIEVIDGPGAGGASHRYHITGAMPGATHPRAQRGHLLAQIGFQNGPIGEHGQNGVTHEALLAIIIDRLESFQAGPYACEENASALAHCYSALASLKTRTAARVARQVEGTSQV